MLEKAKNRKNFYFFLLIILGFSLFTFPVSAMWCNVTGTMMGIDTGSLNTNWNTVHDATTGTASTSSTVYIDGKCYTSSNNYVNLKRIMIKFDTSSIPLDKEIIRVILGVNIKAIDYNTWGEDNISIAYAYPETNPPQGTDFDRFGTKEYGVFPFSLGWNEVEFEDDGIIKKQDISFIGLMLQADLQDTPLPWGNGLRSAVTFNNTASYYPYLYVEYGDSSSPECIINTDVTTGELPLTVNFTDASTSFSESYPYPEYTIYFGDGESYTGERQYTGEYWVHEYENEGTYNATYLVTEDGITYSDSVTITVNDTSTNYQVQVHGLNTAVISGANVSIWYNGDYQDSEGTSASGISYFDVPPYRMVNGTVTKPGYQTAYFDTYIYPENNLEFVTLYLDNEIPGSGDSYGNYIVTFKNAVTGENVGYSNIEVYSDSGFTTLFYDEYSNFGGVWTGLIPMNTTYYYKYPETIGYYSQSWSYNLTSSPAYKTVNLIPKSGATSTTTPTPTTTVTTITPTVTYTYNDSNLSTLNVKERFTNLLVLAGFQNAESADLIFAMIIVLGCTALIGWITLSGSGAGMGAIIGFVFSLGLGLISLWLLIAAIFFGCLYVALKLFGGSGE